MTRTPPTPEEIAAHQRAADRFFARTRGPESLRKLGNERYAPELRAAAAEAKTAHAWGDIARATAERHAAFRKAVTSPLLDDISRNLLRRTRGIRKQNAPQLERNERAAERFFRSVEGRDLSAEITGHVRWARRRREAAARVVWRAFKAAPVDPLTEDEAKLVLTKTPKARWLATLREARRAAEFRAQVRPVGMTLDRALEIAQQVEEGRT